MERMWPILFLILASCSHGNQSPPMDRSVASDAIAAGNVSATVQRKFQRQQVCFQIELKMRSVSQNYAEASNWTVAWIDSDSRYHLLSLNQRHPASIPSGTIDEWTNTFWTCDARLKLQNIDVLLLTPKTLPFNESEGLKFKWN